MAKKCRDNSKYRRVIDQCILEILDGTMVSGSKFYSRATLCERFGISAMTAHKVHRNLLECGFIASSPGNEFIVQGDGFIAPQGTEMLRKVRMIGDINAIGEHTKFGNSIVSGVRAECEKQRLTLNVDLVNVLNNPPGYLNMCHTLASDEGLIVMMHAELLPEIASLVFNPNARIVFIDDFMPGRSVILNDNRGGMKTLIRTALESGAEKLMFAGGFLYHYNSINTFERMEAFQEMTDELKIKRLINMTGNFNWIAEDALAFKPDVIFFAQDDPALHFRKTYLPDLKLETRIFGFDHVAIESELETITTYAVDCIEMGRAAVRELLRPEMIYKPLTHRIPGEIVIGKNSNDLKQKSTKKK